MRDIYLIRAHDIRFIFAAKSVELNNSRSIEDVVLPELKIFSCIFMKFQFMYYDIFDKRGLRVWRRNYEGENDTSGGSETS